MAYALYLWQLQRKLWFIKWITRHVSKFVSVVYLFTFKLFDFMLILFSLVYDFAFEKCYNSVKGILKLLDTNKRETWSSFSLKMHLLLLLVNFLYSLKHLFPCGSSRPEVFCKKSVLRKFTKFTGKHMCQSLFLNKIAGLRPKACSFIKEETLAQVFSGEICEISKNIFFHRTPLVAASLLGHRVVLWNFYEYILRIFKNRLNEALYLLEQISQFRQKNLVSSK